MQNPHHFSARLRSPHGPVLSDLQFESITVPVVLFEFPHHHIGESGLPEMSAADIDGQINVTHAAVPPLGHLVQGLRQHPLADRQDAATCFRDWNELGRAGITQLRVLPPQQHLHPSHGHSRNVYLWLVEQLKFATVQRLSKSPHDRPPTLLQTEGFRIEKAPRVAALVLDLVHGGVAAAQQCVRAVAITRVQRDPDGDRSVNEVGLHHKRPTHGPGHLFGHARRLGFVRIRDHHHKFVPRQSRYQIFARQLFPQALDRGNHEQIAGLMPKRVIDPFEIIDIEIEQRKLVTGEFGIFH